MSAEKRDELRNALLKDLYDYHFSNNGKNKNVAQVVSKDSEYRLAYTYLNEKHLVEYNEHTAGRDHTIIAADVKITTKGIDCIEKEHSIREV